MTCEHFQTTQHILWSQLYCIERQNLIRSLQTIFQHRAKVRFENTSWPVSTLSHAISLLIKLLSIIKQMVIKPLCFSAYESCFLKSVFPGPVKGDCWAFGFQCKMTSLWLPVHYRIDIKLLSSVIKALNWLHPTAVICCSCIAQLDRLDRQRNVYWWFLGPNTNVNTLNNLLLLLSHL